MKKDKGQIGGKGKKCKKGKQKKANEKRTTRKKAQ